MTVRIVISSAPKAGNHWLKCLLARLYDLEWLERDEKAGTKPAVFRAWVAEGGFPDGTIFHQHCRFSAKLADVIEAVPAHPVTIVRDPYDVFVSLYSWVQERAAHDALQTRPRPRDALIGKPLDHPDVLAYLADEFGASLSRANAWLHSGRATVVRYEELHRDPEAALGRAADRIGPVDPARIAEAIEECRAENMRRMNDKLAWHVRAAKVGDSRARLGEEHLAIFRERHADLIRSLGYEVR